ncbi:hypothetical protein G6F65_019551 [Rhizopus arrhizus]|nr:hypothetical protein G6F65_019551 [Rhizopus arrhizus]
MTLRRWRPRHRPPNGSSKECAFPHEHQPQDPDQQTGRHLPAGRRTGGEPVHGTRQLRGGPGTPVPGPAGTAAERFRVDRTAQRHPARVAGTRSQRRDQPVQDRQQPHSGVLPAHSQAVRACLADRLA